MEGWIKLHRSLLDWQWYGDKNTVLLFIHLLLKANHKANKWRGIEVSRGQLITGLQALSEQTGLTFQEVRTALSKLENSHTINKQSNKQHTLITITNYDKYQTDDPESNKQINTQSTNEQQTSNNKQEYKNEKNEKKRGGFTPPTLDEVVAYCKERNNAVNAQRFINHYQSVNWMRGKTKLRDWKAAVRYWEQSDRDKNAEVIKPKKQNIW